MKPLKVSEVNKYIKRVFAGDMILSNIQIEGEISNFSKHYSGHLYFSLKDEKGRIRSVMFKSDAESLTMDLRDGQKIVAQGYISIYDRNGDYQLYIKSVKAMGTGDLFKAFEELKNKLEKEGLFKEKYKKQLPFMPKNIGLVTSSTGAAVKDIITIIERRAPGCNILLYPSLVQGDNAAKNIIQGIKYLDSRQDVDLIIMGRGGGSMEELFAFNDEELARTIFSIKTPIISAVGHETDFTISDFVADLRAATPSAAAELAVENIDYLVDALEDKYKRLLYSYSQSFIGFENELKMISNKLKYNNPINKLKEKRQEIDMIFKDIVRLIEDKQYKHSTNLENLNSKLQLLNPNLSLDKGFGILLNQDGYLVKSIENISIDDEISIVMKDGKIRTLVLDIERGV